jgi:hypothetical protein
LTVSLCAPQLLPGDGFPGYGNAAVEDVFVAHAMVCHQKCNSTRMRSGASLCRMHERIRVAGRFVLIDSC